MLTQTRLKQVLRYQPRTGLFYWLVDKGARAKAGNVAGSISKSTGYVAIGIDGTIYLAHRLAVLYMTGKWPDEIDHKNRKRSKNHWLNLRDGTRSQNLRNAGLSKANKTGFKNIVWDKHRQRYAVRLLIDDKIKTIGRATSIKAAVKIRNQYRQF